MYPAAQALRAETVAMPSSEALPACTGQGQRCRGGDDHADVVAGGADLGGSARPAVSARLNPIGKANHLRPIHIRELPALRHIGRQHRNTVTQAISGRRAGETMAVSLELADRTPAFLVTA